MITLIILIVLFGIGINLTYSFDFDILGVFMSVVFGAWLLCHSLFWGLAGYDYKLFETRRGAFIETLETARSNGFEYETAAIAKDIAEWNSCLAKRKYNNSTLFFDQYNDDRIDLLEPIK